MRTICWEAKTRQTTVSVISDPRGPSFIEIDREHEGPFTPAWARQLATTLLAAADVAEEEERSQE
jgi:hypothetical protein